MRESIAVTLASILWLTPAYGGQQASPPSPQPGADMTSPAPELTAKQAKLRDRMSKVSPDSWIEAKLQDQQTVTGRLKGASAAGFTLLVPKPDKLEDQKITYAELKSLKQVGTIEAKTPTEQALLIPSGSLVTVRLKNRERIKGLLEQVSNDGIVTQVRAANGTEMRRISFAEVQSISDAGGSKVEKGAKTFMWTIIAVGAVMVVVGIVVFLRYATSG